MEQSQTATALSHSGMRIMQSNKDCFKCLIWAAILRQYITTSGFELPTENDLNKFEFIAQDLALQLKVEKDNTGYICKFLQAFNALLYLQISPKKNKALFITVCGCLEGSGQWYTANSDSKNYQRRNLLFEALTKQFQNAKDSIDDDTSSHGGSVARSCSSVGSNMSRSSKKQKTSKVSGIVGQLSPHNVANSGSKLKSSLAAINEESEEDDQQSIKNDPTRGIEIESINPGPLLATPSTDRPTSFATPSDVEIQPLNSIPNQASLRASDAIQVLMTLKDKLKAMVGDSNNLSWEQLSVEQRQAIEIIQLNLQHVERSLGKMSSNGK
jgi:hypothetical protein